MTASTAKCVYTLATVLKRGIAYLLEKEHLIKLSPLTENPKLMQSVTYDHRLASVGECQKELNRWVCPPPDPINSLNGSSSCIRKPLGQVKHLSHALLRRPHQHTMP